MNDVLSEGPSVNFFYRALTQLPHPWAAYRLVTDETGKPLDAVILEVNEAFAALDGREPSALRGLTVREIMAADPSGADSRIALFGKATLDREVTVFDEYRPDRDRWLRVTVTSPEYLLFSTFGVDITELKKAGLRCRESEARLRAFIDNATMAVFVADSEGRYVDVNPAACSLLGFTRDELLNRSIPDLVPPDRIEESFRAFESLKSAGRAAHETRLCRKDGRSVEVSLVGIAFDEGTYLAYCQELASFRNADRARDRFLSAFMAVDRPIFLLDSSGTFLEANDRFLGLYGYGRSELPAMGAGFIDPGFETCMSLGYNEREYAKLYDTLWHDVKNPSVRVWDGVLPNRRKDGSLFWNHLALRGIFNVDGTLDSIVGFPAEIPTSPLYDARD